MGAVMHFQRTLNRFSRENVPGYLAVFIGGFGDMFAGCLSRVEKGFPGFLPGVAYATAYYHWDGGGCGVFFDRCGKIAVELEELRRRYPGLPVVLIGHSYGGSCAVEVARRQSVQAAPLCLLTVDAVARRQKSVRPDHGQPVGERSTKNINHTNNMIDPIAMTSLAELSGNVGFGLVTIGAGLGIGLIGAKAAEATGRNPGASSPIMVIAITLAALIEGVALISIFVK